jgi:methylmalonyl-CoA mutase, C-terminal domain
MPKLPRIVIAKPGLDGHDRGAKVIARALMDAGFEVIYTGRHQTPEQIVAAVIQEDAGVLGMSILSGAHITLVQEVTAQFKKNGVNDVRILVGGTIPVEDFPELRACGVDGIFTPGTKMSDVVDLVRAFAADVESAETTIA